MRDGVLDAVRRLLPAIAAAASEADRDGVIDPGIVAGLQDAGVFAMLQPESFGGQQADPSEHLTVIREISAACTSTGWLAGMLGVANWHLALFDPRAQRDVWGPDRRALVCASYAPTGHLERSGDGYRLSGRWSRCTGVRHASWLIVGAVVVGNVGAAEDFTVALIPRADCVVESTWNAVGLRGIGADDVVVSGAAVPGYRTFAWIDPDQRAGLPPLYRLPQPTLYTHCGTAPVLGAAFGALAGRPAGRSPLSTAAVATADLDLSVLQMRRNLSDLMDCARADTDPGPELMLRARRDQVLAFERAERVVGALAHRRGPDLHRVWRDVQTARMHVANDVDRVLTAVGQFAFGVPVDDFIL